MDPSNPFEAGEFESLPPPPPIIPPNVVPVKPESGRTHEKMKKTVEPERQQPMARIGTGSKGKRIELIANHFRVGVGKTDGHYFYRYSVALSYGQDYQPVLEKNIRRRAINEMVKKYAVKSKMETSLAYDGDNTLFTNGALEREHSGFTCQLELEEFYAKGKIGISSKKKKIIYQTIKVVGVMNYVDKIPLQVIADAVNGKNFEHSQIALRVLNTILRQHAANQECLLVGQSFFPVRPGKFIDLGGGVQGCRGFHSSFQATQEGLTLNLDMSTTILVKPVSVVDFLCLNQDVLPKDIDWTKAERMLKNLRIRVNGREYKITGLSKDTCIDQIFDMKAGKDHHGNRHTFKMSVFGYYKYEKKVVLTSSADMPCIDVGRSKPTFFPLELCTLVPLQPYKKALTNLQRDQLEENSRIKPELRKTILLNSLRESKYGDGPMVHTSGITIEHDLARIEGRILPAPELMVIGGSFFPQNGRWNFNNKELLDPKKIEHWAIVDFSDLFDIELLKRTITSCAQNIKMDIKDAYTVFKEDKRNLSDPAPVRVEKMYGIVKAGLPGHPQLLLCILPERKNSDIYGPWKRKCLVDEGVATQCIAQTKINNQYITNVLLKINAKLDGINFSLYSEYERSIPFVSDARTLILGMDVSHGSPGRSDMPSIAAVVGSRKWPRISRYRAEVRAQSPKVEMIESLYKPDSATGEDHGIIRQLLLEFEDPWKRQMPEQIIIFRDGVSESMFNQVLKIELGEIIKACEHHDKSKRWNPKFTYIVAQKNHHTRFFQANAPENVKPGTVIDTSICHPKNNDFYMCAHAGTTGTTRPTHYHVLRDDIGFSEDDLQELVHSLSYSSQRSTTAISVVAPIHYAHLAAAQMGKFLTYEEMPEMSSSHGGPLVPQLPPLHKNVANTMFFC